ncbi:Uncharacterized protein PRO82_000191 [Candidatus Protochlamydia amoebophila]|nr:Uncharacterized protein [Candidatus Protochlamydia amoebophila]
MWGIFMPHTSSIVCLHIVFLILSKHEYKCSSALVILTTYIFVRFVRKKFLIYRKRLIYRNTFLLQI